MSVSSSAAAQDEGKGAGGSTAAEGAKVFVMGSSNIDLVSHVKSFPGPGETIFGDSFSRKFGGKGANQAMCAAKLGADVTMLTMVGKDSFGDDYKNHYASHMDTS